MGMCNFWSKNGPLLLKIFFGYKQIKKYRDTADLELWGCTIFGPKMVHLTQTHFFFFFEKSLILFSSTYPSCLFAQILKNSSSRSGVMRMHNFWAQNGPFSQMRLFSENLLMNLVLVIHAYLQAKNQSQILIY